jgi:4a-hydroxytetrahydrobiopterin dehydratase
MVREEKLTAAVLAQAMTDVPGWSVAAGEGAIQRQLTFPDFVTAFAFMTEVALLAERADHHPEWRQRFNRVDILLTTHDHQGVTRRDIALALAIDQRYLRYRPSPA